MIAAASSAGSSQGHFEAQEEPGALRISVLSQMDPAFPRTHSIAVIRLCAGLAAQGHLVELVVPAIAKPRPPTRALFETYDLEPNFDVRYLSVGSRSGDYDAWFLWRLVGRHVGRAVWRDGSRVLISDGIRLLLPYVAAGRVRRGGLVTAPWLHEFRNTRLERLACAHSTCVLATCHPIVSDLAAHGVSRSQTFVTGNPVPAERVEFGRRFSKQQARRRLALDERRPLITYTGKLYLGMRELDYVLEAAKRLPECLFLFTGGQPPVIERLSERFREQGIENVQLTGMLRRPEEARYYQQAADVLVSYYSLEDLPFARHHIPSKLAEYMTTGNLIVAADFPAVRDLLSAENSFLVEPDDVDALTAALDLAVTDRDGATELGARAQRDIAGRTSEAVTSELGKFLVRLSRSIA